MEYITSNELFMAIGIMVAVLDIVVTLLVALIKKD